MKQESPVDIAVAALEELESTHLSFMQTIAGLKTKKVNGGEIETDGHGLRVTCLGVVFDVRRRLIARGETFEALEYPFVALHRDQQVIVWRMYLEMDGCLYAKAGAQDKICPSDNTYLASSLIERLTSPLLRSPLFAPLG